ncbi:Xylose isormerase (TIM barrel) domain-containing protein [Desulfonema limicola]|uniref:Xylose isormerase (TIM barrel) domain-containing protein n=1 Tax=Desulfonema limicola TaxID=45656 RepID=A0A975B578_9BACT|nr:sugar phosphate isomerase/epimerase family protein [Desulfonema limicola]QTA78993.1 Xylose isormerase (TIM barrel) domain-containing protein [Desulfonema limicola]
MGDTYLPSWIEPDEKQRKIRIQHTLDCLKTADILGCRNISVPPGGPLGNMERKEAAALFYKGLEHVIPVAEELGINILIEPEPGLFIENTREFKSFIKDVKSESVGLNFDIGHFYCVGEDPGSAFEELYQWIGHVHLEDIALSRVHQHLIPGHGAISFKHVFQSMKKMNYTKDICLELYPYTDTPEQAGRESLEFLRPIFEDAGLDIIK